MSSNDGSVYMIRGDAADGDTDAAESWVSPAPADDVITDALVAETDLDPEAVDGIESYVDRDTLRAVVGDGDSDATTFEVEGHDVTVHSNGRVDVA